MSKSDIVVVGGGIVGAFSCYHLLKNKFKVTWVTGPEVRKAAVWGSAGIIAVGVGVPLPSYESLSRVARWVLEKESPIKINPKFLFSRLGWLLSYVKRSRVILTEEAMKLLREMSLETKATIDEIISSRLVDADFFKKGMLMTYTNREKLERHLHDLKTMKNPAAYKALDSANCRSLEPSLSTDVVGGILFEEDAWVDPSKFISEMRELIGRMDAKVLSEEATGIKVSDGRIQSIEVGGSEVKGDEYVFAMGSYTRRFLSKINLNLPVAPAWGHRVTLGPTSKTLAGPVMLGDHRLAVSQTSDGHVRVTGFFELSDTEFKPPDSRYTWLKDKASQSLPFTKTLPQADKWSGMRPCTPDGLPLVGRASKVENLLLAVGHAREGLTLSAATGRIISDILKSETEAHPLIQPGRFGL